MTSLAFGRRCGARRHLLVWGGTALAMAVCSSPSRADGTRIVPMDKFSIVNDVDQAVSLTFFPDTRTDSLDEAETQDWDCAGTKAVTLNDKATKFAVSCGAAYAVRVDSGSLVLVVLTGGNR